MTETSAEPKRKLPLRSVLAVVLALVAALAAPCGAEAYQSVDKYVSGGHGYLNASYLVIHETANPGASAYNHTLLWSRDDTYAVHHVMELDGSTVYNTVAENRLCWHVGNGNGYTIGIELAHATNAADFSKQWGEAVKWAGDELRAHGWDTSRLLSHYEAAQRWGGSDHTDPNGYFAQFGKSWWEFKQAVAAYLGSGYVAPIAPTNGSGGTYEGGWLRLTGGQLPEIDCRLRERPLCAAQPRRRLELRGDELRRLQRERLRGHALRLP